MQLLCCRYNRSCRPNYSMTQAMWTTRLLHQLADRLQNIIDKNTEDQAVKQIDVAIGTAAVHPFDPFASLDLHKMVNDIASEVGRSERPRFNPPSEMAFLRSKHSQHAAQLSRSMVSMLAHSDPTSDEMDRAIERLFGQIDYNVRTLAPKISSARVEAAKISTQLRDAVEASFASFLAAAKVTGIERNVVGKKRDPLYLSKISLPTIRMHPADEAVNRPAADGNVQSGSQDLNDEPLTKRKKKAESPETSSSRLDPRQLVTSQPRDEQMSVDVLRDIIRLVSTDR